MTTTSRRAAGRLRPSATSRALLRIGLATVLSLPLGAGVGFGVAPARAAENADIAAEPKALIDETATQIVAILARRDQPAEERVEKIEAIAYDVFDFTTMSKLVLARNWRKLDKEKRAEFVREFKQNLSRTYGTRIDRYDQEKIDVYDSRVEPRDDVSVMTRIIGGEFDGAEITYRLRNRQDRWRIIDVVIEGVSLVSNYRSQFAEILNSGTIDDLLAKLRDKNFVIEEEKKEKEG
jgi:phospholipid transport system substrate-binding protein